jgi:hydrogenase nickel incorporation protein HypB
MDRAAAFARKLNKDIEIFNVSCRTGDGLEGWYGWLKAAVKAKRQAA